LRKIAGGKEKRERKRERGSKRGRDERGKRKAPA